MVPKAGQRRSTREPSPADVAARLSHAGYVDAAMGLLRDPAHQAGWRSLTMAKASALAGTSRSSLYRWWPTIADLEADLAVEVATRGEGWDVVLAVDPADGIAPAVRAMAEGRNLATGTQARAAIATWPDGPRRRAVARWEEAKLVALSRWLPRALPDAPRDLPWFDLAAAATSLVEGAALLHSLLAAPHDDERWSAIDAAALGVAVERLVVELSQVVATVEPGTDDREATAGEPDTGAGTGGRERALRRIEAAAVDLAASAPDAIGVARLVDPARLGRLLGVSLRRIYLVWPSATAQNGDLLVRSISDHRRRIGDLTDQTLSAALSGSYTRIRDLSIAALELISTSSTETARPFFSCLASTTDPVVRERARHELVDWMRGQRVELLAYLWVAGHRTREHVSTERYTEGAFAITLGLQRLLMLHPTYLDRTVVYRGQRHRSLAVTADAFFNSMTVHLSDDGEQDGSIGIGSWRPSMHPVPWDLE